MSGCAQRLWLILLSVVDYLLKADSKGRDEGAAVAILVIYFLLFILVLSSYFRLLYIVSADPGYIPLGAAAERQRLERKGHRSILKLDAVPNLGPRPLNNSGNPEIGHEYPSSETELDAYYDPDSPGLENFYTKDVFICEEDGRPKWCSDCSNWKPDRAHHCSDIGRCVRKMDHFCPW